MVIRRDDGIDMTGVTSVEVPLVRTLAPPSEGDEVVSMSVSPAGEAVAMWASAVDRACLFEQEHTGRGVFPTPRPATPVVARLTVDTPHVRRAVVPLTVETNFPTAHLLPEGRILVVGGRARWRPEGPEHNGYVYSAEGALERSACLGDGVLLTT
jgi:hypothetical protein